MLLNFAACMNSLCHVADVFVCVCVWASERERKRERLCVLYEFDNMLKSEMYQHWYDTM